MNKKFTYKTTVSWTEEKKGILSSPGKPAIDVATPPEFKGHEGMWTPEELFVASVNICIMTTFLHFAQRENFEFLSYKSEAQGLLEMVEKKFMFSTIKVMPKITVSSSIQVSSSE